MLAGARPPTDEDRGAWESLEGMFAAPMHGVAACPAWFRKLAWNRLEPGTKGAVIRFQDEEPCSHFLFLYAKLSPMNGAFLELIEKLWIPPARSRSDENAARDGAGNSEGNLKFRHEMRSTGVYFWAHELPAHREEDLCVLPHTLFMSSRDVVGTHEWEPFSAWLTKLPHQIAPRNSEKDENPFEQEEEDEGGAAKTRAWRRKNPRFQQPPPADGDEPAVPMQQPAAPVRASWMDTVASMVLHRVSSACCVGLANGSRPGLKLLEFSLFFAEDSGGARQRLFHKVFARWFQSGWEKSRWGEIWKQPSGNSFGGEPKSSA
jgi:hypothetical protein